MLKYKLDVVTKDKKTGIFTAYIQIMDGGKIAQTISLLYDNDESFKERLKIKATKTEADYTEKEGKKMKIEKILEGM